ncbi:hypothetical protein ACFQL4_20460 [Halosimplex aquaticum]
MFSGSDNPQEAWNLLNYTNTSADHLAELYATIYPAAPTYEPLSDTIKSEYGDQLSQPLTAMLNAAQEYGPQYNVTGAAWDLKETSQIRWTDINEPISQAIAGKFGPDKAVSTIVDNVNKTMSGS